MFPHEIKHIRKYLWKKELKRSDNNQKIFLNMNIKLAIRIIKKNKTNSVALSPRANYTD
jgi:hypothetical protein